MGIGTIILAAGVGRRLGRGVKALVEVAKKPLIEHLLEKCHEDVIVYTSKYTHEPLKAYLRQKKLSQVFLLQEKSEGAFPLGNGTLYETLLLSPIFQKWQEKQISRITVIPIDNPLANPRNQELLAGDLCVLGVKKLAPNEKMGAVIYTNQTLKIIEYSELSEEQKNHLDIGYAGIFSADIRYFEKAGKEELAFHTIVRNGVTYKEKFIFDAFHLANSPKLVVCERKENFCPIKVESDIAIAEKILYTKSS